MVMDFSFWQNKTVLITGHTGFKGGWLSLWLHQLGANVIGYSLNPPSQPNLFTLANIKKNVIHIEGDVGDYDCLKTTLDKHKPEIIFHMAAQSLVRYSYENPIETYSTNVMGTVNLLEAARIVGCSKVIVNITSDKCYENKEWQWPYRENDVLGGYDPYSNSKACSELVTSAFRNSYFNGSEYCCGLASARAGNVIGGGDWAKDRLIPDIIRSFINNTDFIVRYPQALRPWQHVLEPLHGYLQLAELLYFEPSNYTGAWNFGPEQNDVKTVDWIVKKIQQIFNKPLSVKYNSDQNKHEASLLKLDSSKAKNYLSWKQCWDLETGLLKTIEWYKSYINGEDMHKKTNEQINEYSILL
jgi:CDP-glucose 4,6-dehydratase